MNTAVKTAIVCGALVAAGCARDAAFPVYGFTGQAPWHTIIANEDDAYSVGDMVTVKGNYYAGGTDGGSVVVFEVSEEPVRETRWPGRETRWPGRDADILDVYPILQRRFFLNRLEAGPDEITIAEVTGNIVADDVYHYGYLLDVLSAAPVKEPNVDEDKVRADLSDAADAIRRIDLDDITGRFHHQYNKGYKIVADPAAAEVTWAGTDYVRGPTVVKAALEQLPPYDDPRLYRELDAYLVYPGDGGDCLWAVVCVGGYFFE